MVIANVGTDKIAEEIGPLITYGEWGTDNTDADPTDTALISPVASTKIATTYSRSGSNVTVTHSVPSTVGNGNTLKEFALMFSDDTLLLRAVGADILKQTGYELQTITQLSFSRG